MLLFHSFTMASLVGLCGLRASLVTMVGQATRSGSLRVSRVPSCYRGHPLRSLSLEQKFNEAHERTHRCAEVSLSDVGSRVQLTAWLGDVRYLRVSTEVTIFLSV